MLNVLCFSSLLVKEIFVLEDDRTSNGGGVLSLQAETKKITNNSIVPNKFRLDAMISLFFFLINLKRADILCTSPFRLCLLSIRKSKPI